MRLRHLAFCFALGIVPGVTSHLAAQDPEIAASREGEEVLARGPLHEAFAAATTFAPQAGMTIKTAPPEAIEEVPPDQKPEGETVAWIPGYWGWDDEREDFIWISGVWRTLPPGRQWIAGYWAESEEGHQWISGYWADAKYEEVRYYPEPPKSLERGPSVEAPSVEHVWIPGVWLWQEGRHAWRPGYWMRPQANWVWCPSYWVWTPSGCVFVDGYWDYAIPRRGIVYCPVYLDRRIYTRPNYSYRPTLVINPVVFLSHIFLRPQYSHYYYGDYYAADYASMGIYPRFTYQYRYGFDPLFAYQTWQHREDRDWLVSVKQRHERLVLDESARPPRTFDPRWVNASLEGDVVSNVVATSLTQVNKTRSTSYQFTRMAEVDRRELTRNVKEIRQHGQERKKSEVRASVRTDATVKTGAKSEPVTVKRVQSPISTAKFARTEGRGREREPREVLKPEPGTREPSAGEPGAREPGTRPGTRPSRDPADSPALPRDPRPEPGEKGKGKGKGKGLPGDPSPASPPDREPRPPMDRGPKDDVDPFAPKEPGSPKIPTTPKEPRETLPGDSAPDKPATDDVPPPSPERDPAAPTPGAKADRPLPSDRAKPARPDREKSPRPDTSPRSSETPDLEKPKSGGPKARPMPGTDPFAPRPGREKAPRPDTSPRSPESPDLDKPKSGGPKARPMPDTDPFAPRPEPRGKARPEPREPKSDAPKAPKPKDPPSLDREPVKPAPPDRGSESPPKGNKGKGGSKEPKKKDKPEKSPEDEFPK